METAFKGSLVAEPVDWEAARRFHGHLGPWLSLGMRIGVSGLESTEAEPHFGVRVDVVCRLSPPVSCMLDGLQLATGATYGKRNLCAEEGEPFVVRVSNTSSGSSAVYTVSGDTVDTFRRWIQEDGEERATLRAWSEADGVLFSRADHLK